MPHNRVLSTYDPYEKFWKLFGISIFSAIIAVEHLGKPHSTHNGGFEIMLFFQF